jgi:hypothetical protein
MLNLIRKEKENRNRAVSVDLPYATWGVSTHEPNLTKRQTMMLREGHRQERKKKGGEHGPSCIKQSNKQTKPPKGFTKKHKFVALTRVSDPALHNSGTAVRRNVPLAARQAPTAAFARSPVLPACRNQQCSWKKATRVRGGNESRTGPTGK